MERTQSTIVLLEPAEPLFTFARVREHLSRTGRPLAAGPDGRVLQCTWDAGGESIPVAMRALHTNAGKEWLALAIPLGAAEEFRPRAALVANDVLPLGALANWKGTMLLRQTLPLTSLTGPQLEQALTSMVHAARLILLGRSGRGLAFLYADGGATP